jgi:triosephosphate isomerase
MLKKLYVANWKMNMPVDRAATFIANHNNDLQKLNNSPHATIVLCPSFISLGMVAPELKKASIPFGAQDCSAYPTGPYTGDVDALSLKQIGCSYCIVGHSERRQYHHETDAIIAQKVAQLQLHNIIPIVCIGETVQERASDIKNVLYKQLTPILTVSAATQGQLCIAYEPIWAIGSGKTPTTQELVDIFSWLKETIDHSIINTTVRYVYGGSVTPTNIGQLKSVTLIDGFLIGGASTDFQSLQKIVL